MGLPAAVLGDPKAIEIRPITRSRPLEPKIMLFDEPTSALDPAMIKEVLDGMRELAATGTTMLVVTHEMGFATAVAHRVIFMDFGEIIEQNEPHEFFKNPQHDRTKLCFSQILHHFVPTAAVRLDRYPPRPAPPSAAIAAQAALLVHARAVARILRNQGE